MERRIDMILRLTLSVRRKLLPKSSYRYLHTQLNRKNDNEFDNELKNKINKYKDKILYNTLVHGENQSFLKELRKRRQIYYEKKLAEKQEGNQPSVSICATYLKELKNPSIKLQDNIEIKNNEEQVFNLPFNKPNLSVKNNFLSMKDPGLNGDWLKDYEHFDDSKLKIKPENIDEFSDDDGDEMSMNTKLFSIDPRSKVSNIPCGGCGAFLHCKDTSIPGFIPSEIFKKRKSFELRSVICQRCHFLKEYNIALNLNVSPQEYIDLLMKIRNEKALVMIMVDLLDFPCSIWPGIMDILVKKRPVFIVGNKVDLLPQDSRGYLRHISECLKKSLMESALKDAFIKHVALISAKSGYGIEELITQLHQHWEAKGDVYLVGCTNVGKSTLFNALVQSDYCKVQATESVQRATVSQWPGTTLNLLKFPILRPSNWRLAMRNKRLHREMDSVRAEAKLRSMQLQMTNDAKYASLTGHVGRTFIDPKTVDDMSVGDPFSYQMTSGFTQSGPTIGINEKSKSYVNSKWFYDSPGVVHPDQILSILTVDELMLTIPKELLRPRSFYMQKGMTLFLAGLARLDILESEQQVLLTVFASKNLPITVCHTENAEEIYETFLGTDVLGVPIGNSERLDKWPLLCCNDTFTIAGEGWKSSSADIVLSSAGWVSITGKEECNHELLAWTPEGRGIYKRTPSLLRNAIQLRGKRIHRTPAYNVGYFYKTDR